MALAAVSGGEAMKSFSCNSGRSSVEDNTSNRSSIEGFSIPCIPLHQQKHQQKQG